MQYEIVLKIQVSSLSSTSPILNKTCYHMVPSQNTAVKKKNQNWLYGHLLNNRGNSLHTHTWKPTVYKHVVTYLYPIDVNTEICQPVYLQSLVSSQISFYFCFFGLIIQTQLWVFFVVNAYVYLINHAFYVHIFLPLRPAGSH